MPVRFVAANGLVVSIGINYLAYSCHLVRTEVNYVNQNIYRSFLYLMIVRLWHNCQH